MVNDYRRQTAGKKGEYVPSADTLSGVLLTSLTSMIGFGSLMISQHHGLQTVGQIMAVGVGSCMLVALVLLPALLTLVARHQPASMEPIRISKKTVEEDDKNVKAEPANTKQAQKNDRHQKRRAA